MSLIIGIIERNGLSETGKKIGVVYSEIERCVINSGGIPVGISNNKIELYFDICNGFIFQGGDFEDEKNMTIIKRLYDKDVPVLGICLGMQEMALAFGGKLDLIDNHYINGEHMISLNKDSLLRKIVGTETMMVNSRHRFVVNKCILDSVAYSENGFVEAIEDKDKKFFVGVQWHPEDMYDKTYEVRQIFDYFIKMCHD